MSESRPFVAGVDSSTQSCKVVICDPVRGRIARDLTLTQLRTRWQDTPTSALEAVEAWKGHYPKRAPYDGPLWEDRIRALEHFRTHLDRLSPTDHVGLANAAADIAGLLHAQAITARTSGGRDMLERAAIQVGRCAQLKTRPTAKRVTHSSARAVCEATLMAGLGATPQGALIALHAELAALVEDIARLHEASEQLYTARAIRRDAEELFARTSPVHTRTSDLTDEMHRAFGITSVAFGSFRTPRRQQRDTHVQDNVPANGPDASVDEAARQAQAIQRLVSHAFNPIHPSSQGAPRGDAPIPQPPPHRDTGRTL